MQCTVQVISLRALREFWMLEPQSRESLLAWLRLITGCEHENFESLRQTFGSALYVAPYTVFRIGRCNARLISVIHYIRRRVFIRHVLPPAHYEEWMARVGRKYAVREPSNGVPYAVPSSGLARAADTLSGEIVLHYERASQQSDERVFE